jgi:hypothetical protein
MHGLIIYDFNSLWSEKRKEKILIVDHVGVFRDFLDGHWIEKGASSSSKYISPHQLALFIRWKQWYDRL